MELNWKEDNNLVRKIAKILLGEMCIRDSYIPYRPV